MRLGELEALLSSLAPPAAAEPWDNVGLLVGDRDAPVETALFCVDLTSEVEAEARRVGAELVVAYHPPLFEPVRRLDASSLVFRAIRAGVAIFSPHTALDVVAGGTNDVLADLVGLAERTPLRPRAGDENAGLGRVGTLAEALSRVELLARIKREVGVEQVLTVGTWEGVARRVAVGAGSCGDLYKDALAAGADVYLTGELRHHDALACAARGLAVACVLHSNSERRALAAFAERVQRALPNVRILVSTVDRDPFTIR